ncbi:MAG: CoA-binding protein [Fimbriimonadia bacterium]|nr:CoA-binding protein [Fimbriimonadia bacterium]
MSSSVCEITLNSILTPEQKAKYQNPARIQEILGKARTIAVVGLSADPQKASHMVASYLQYEGFRVIPVNPTRDEILGMRSYPDLLSIPEPVDGVDVFRPAEECEAIARQAVEMGAKSLWLQLRIVSLRAAEIAEAGGLSVVMDKCMKIEHGRYGGSLRWIGANTEIISARRKSPR